MHRNPDHVSEPCEHQIYSMESSVTAKQNYIRDLAAELGWTLIETEAQAAQGADGKSPEAPPSPN